MCLYFQPCGVGDDLCEAEDFVCDYHLEMLSLSQDQQNPVSILFDDSGWQNHLPSLKPLGLNILLNLCNVTVTQQLCRFSDHLSNLALQECHGAVLPIHVPWGLCELSRLIGKTLCGSIVNKHTLSGFIFFSGLISTNDCFWNNCFLAKNIQTSLFSNYYIIVLVAQ